MDLKEFGMGSSRPKHTIYSIDNGEDIRGTNSTDQFVTKAKDETGKYIKEPQGTKLEGVVILNKAKVNSKYGANPSWYSYEFNPIDKDEAITVVIGDKKSKMPYSQIKSSHQTPDGKNDFQYITMLYIKTDNETIKLQLKGKPMGSWFDFQGENENPLGFKTIMNIVKGDKEFNEITFEKGEDVDINEMVKEARAINQKPVQLVGPEAPIEAVPDTPMPTPAQAPDNTPEIPDFTNADAPAKTDEEIMDEIPF